VDEKGNVIRGYKGAVRLWQKGSYTEPPKKMDATMTDGVVEFTVRATTKAGVDEYWATFEDADKKVWQTNKVRIAVQDSSNKTLISPVIDDIFGVKDGKRTSDSYVVQPTDDAMRICLVEQEDGLVAVKVYRGSSLVWTSPVIDIDSDSPCVDVPRSLLPSSGTVKYRVQLVNAVGTSAYSSEREVKLVGFNSASITSVAVDGSGNKLIITARNLNTKGTIDPSKLWIINPNTDAIAVLYDGVPLIKDSSTIELTFPDLAQKLKPNQFYGANVYLSAQTGWYVDPNENLARADLTDNKVEPLAWVERAEIDVKGSRIFLYGKGFTTGTVNSATVADTMKVKQPSTKKELPLKNYVEKVELTDTRIVIYLQSKFEGEFQKQFSGGGLILEATAGWLTKGKGKSFPFTVDLPERK